MTDLSSDAAALKPLLQMCKDCDASNISTIRTLILKALTHAEIFAGFDEIKLAVQPKLASASDGEALLRTLDLFSYGTFKDYSSNTGSFVTLTEAQLQKLKMLTVVTLVERACTAGGSVVSYETVAQELSLTTTSAESLRQVEELVIGCIYAGIVNGKLCQQTRRLILSSQHGPPCRARDVQSVSSMITNLKSLQKNLESCMSTMEVEKMDIQQRRDANTEFWKEAAKNQSDSKAAPAAGGGWSTSAAAARTVDFAHRVSSTFSRKGKRSRGGLGDPMQQRF